MSLRLPVAYRQYTASFNARTRHGDFWLELSLAEDFEVDKAKNSEAEEKNKIHRVTRKIIFRIHGYKYTPPRRSRI